MSELINTHDDRATIRWKLLTGASALALTAYVASSGTAAAGDADRPLVWLELGGQMEQLEGLSAPVTAPFMSITPTPGVYKGFPFTGIQNAPRFAFGEESAISFQPEDSNWIFSAGIRYGRSHTKRHTHQQSSQPIYWTYLHTNQFLHQTHAYHLTSNRGGTQVLADGQTKASENHLILDFTAGKDVGLGLFGREGSSTVSAGVRFASFKLNSSTLISGRPVINYYTTAHISYKYPHFLIRTNHLHKTFYQYTMSAHAARSFRGVGPTLSWKASAAIAGNEQNGELTLDWGIDAALLFGKQKAKTSHTTQAYHKLGHQVAVSGYLSFAGYTQYYQKPHHSTRSRNVTVPDIGAYAGLSMKYTNVKFSVGYRYETFLNAMDMGIDKANKSNVTFHGPYASISIGLGD